MSDDSGGAHDYVVVMDYYGGEWTPFAVLADASEAIQLREWLSNDAKAACSTGPYYPSKPAVLNGESEEAPEGLDELSVTFAESDVVAISDEDLAAREAQFEKGGLRKTLDVYDTAAEVAADKPSAVGKFLSAELTADDILEAVR